MVTARVKQSNTTVLLGVVAPNVYKAAVSEADVVALCPNKVVGVSRSSEMSSTTVTTRAKHNSSSV